MRYVSLLLLVALMSWSWSVITRVPPVTEIVHASIQDSLKEIIANYIRESLPTSKNLTFEKMWTEVINEDKVKASFTYSFDDENEEKGSARVSIEGVAVLNRLSQTTPEGASWSFDELYMLNNHIVFKEGFTLTPSATNAN